MAAISLFWDTNMAAVASGENTLLNLACLVVIPGRVFLRGLINLTVGIRQPRHYIYPLNNNETNRP